MEYFKPIGKVARWKPIYELFKMADEGTIISYRVIAHSCGMAFPDEISKLRSAIERARKEHLEVDQRAMECVAGEGYRPVPPSTNLTLARRQNRKAGRALKRGHSLVTNVDLNRLSQQQKDLALTMGRILTQQQDFNRRILARTVNIEAMVTEKTEKNEVEINNLKERLERLENLRQ